LIDAIVPVVGARSVVAASAFCAPVRLSWALWTSASAAASEIWVPPAAEPPEPPEPEPPDEEPPPCEEPLVAKFRSTCLAGERLPLPETVDWTTRARR
jgi:hypothetical protein